MKFQLHLEFINPLICLGEPSEITGDIAGIVFLEELAGEMPCDIAVTLQTYLRHQKVSSIILKEEDFLSFCGPPKQDGPDSPDSPEGPDRSAEWIEARFALCKCLVSQGVLLIMPIHSKDKKLFERVSSELRVIHVGVNSSHSKRLQNHLQLSKEETMRSLEKPNFLCPSIIIDICETTSSSQQIMQFYLDTIKEDIQNKKKLYWKTYYEQENPPEKPSTFAVKVESELEKKMKILEIGCGNGRDASYFGSKGHLMTAIDISESAIKVCSEKYRGLPIAFRVGKLNELTGQLETPYDALYCRFVLHAMTLREEIELLTAANGVLNFGGLFYMECRSIKDPLSQKGKVISRTERIHGHYRRFIVMEELLQRLNAAGFEVVERIEAAGLAIHGNDDPVVIRIKAKKTLVHNFALLETLSSTV